MGKFSKKGKRGMAAISTASLPDVVFMLLFFFMVSTKFRDTEKKVEIKLPEASESAKLERRDLTSVIYVGSPVITEQGKYGTDTRLQLNDDFSTVSDIRDFIAAARDNMSEVDRQFMTVSIKGDGNVRMGIITDVKQELRRCSALKVMYAARKSGPTPAN